jgi:hypothetical protein
LLEAALVPSVLALWPAKYGGFVPGDARHMFLAATFSALLFVLRPPSLLFFVVPGVRGLLLSVHRRSAFLLLAGPWLAVLASNAAVDWLFYNQRLVLPWWNFLVFNGLDGGASHFGIQPWYYYVGLEVRGLLF